jgi:hypothetical protein
MAFLQSGLFAALAPLLLLPLLIHLLSRRLTKPLKFPSVRHLKVSMTRSAAIYRWRHWLFLILRTLLLLLILLAFLLPIFYRYGAPAPAAQRTVLIAIDNSLSMEHRDGGQRARDRAISEAERIIGTLRAGDHLNVLRVQTDTTPAFPVPSEEKARALSFLHSIPAGVTRADFSRANHPLAGMSTELGNATEIYYLSDFQRSDWSNVDFRPLPESARVFFVDVGAKTRNNRALTSLRMEGDSIAGGLVTVEIELSNFSSKGTDEVVQLLLDGRPAAEQSIYVAPDSIATAKIPLALPLAGKHLLEAQIPSDALQADDKLFAVLEIDEKEEILLLTQIDYDTRSGVDYLEAALNPFFGSAGSINPRRIHANELIEADLASVTKLFITRAGPIAPAQTQLLAEFLFSGGGIVWFLDDPNDADNLAKLANALGNESTALQLGSWYETKSLDTAHKIIGGDFNSPFLKLFAGTQRQDLGRLEVYDNFSAAFTGEGQKLLSFADGTPAMTEQTHGLGQLLLLNFSPDTQHSNLAKQRFFPVWMQSILQAFGSDQSGALYQQVGNRIVTNVWKTDIRQSRFSAPDGQAIKPSIEINGQRATVAFNTSQLGIYHLTNGDQLIAAFAVNPPSEEADLRPIQMGSLPERRGTPEQSTLLQGASTDFEHTALGYPLFHWFICAALLCVLTELGLHTLVRHHHPQATQK